ncbi:hypothetical protein [Paraburkholderia phytofirmans]|uniref:hypothetical protein n=1 Tax=Paraburkholderia phytofirmans TaxID=261302 RepID=UPI0038BC893D
MNLFDLLAQSDWTRAARFWILVAAGLAVWESAVLFLRALNARLMKGGDDVQ